MSDLVSGLLAKLSEVEEQALSISAGRFVEGLTGRQVDPEVTRYLDTFADPDAVLRLCRAHRDIVKRFQWAWERRNTGTDDEQALRQMYVIAMIDVLSELARGLGVEEQGSE